MQYITTYQSPLGEILLAADETGLTGLWFEGEKYYALNLDVDHKERETRLLSDAKSWLTIYFSGKEPDFMPPMHMLGTAFQKTVWEILRTIPYGETTTYGKIAEQVAKKRGPVSYTHLDVYKRQMYSGGFYPFETLEEYWAYWSRYIELNRYSPADVYKRQSWGNPQ